MERPAQNVSPSSPPTFSAAGRCRSAVAIGASNISRGLAALALVAGERLGRDGRLIAIAGRGRSFGTPSKILVRRLPSILDSGAWAGIASAQPTAALVTDVGNDIMYGQPPEAILRWVEEVLARLRAAGARPVLAGLPMPRLERVGKLGYDAMRSILFAGTRTPSYADAMARAREVDAGLRSLAERMDATCVAPDPAWYGLDPIHVRASRHVEAWRALTAPWTAGEASADATGQSQKAAGECKRATRVRLRDVLRAAATMPQEFQLFGLSVGRPDGPPGRLRLQGGAEIELH